MMVAGVTGIMSMSCTIGASILNFTCQIIFYQLMYITFTIADNPDIL